MDTEIWKDINGSDGNYRISSFGRVFSVRKGIYMKLFVASNGYMIISIPLPNKKVYYIHRLMAEHFIENPKNYLQVHHIDNDRGNYSLSNLMWCDQSYNVKVEYDTGRRIGKTNMRGLFGSDNPTSKWVVQISLDGTPIRTIGGLTEAARIVNGCPSHIAKVCRGKLKKHAGYKWKYA